MSFPTKKRLTSAEVLETIDFFTEDGEKGLMKSETTIFVTPPQEAKNNLSEEVSADEECTKFGLNDLGRKLVCAEAEAYQQGASLLVNKK